jgi:hypothetical protein
MLWPLGKKHVAPLWYAFSRHCQLQRLLPMHCSRSSTAIQPGQAFPDDLHCRTTCAGSRAAGPECVCVCVCVCVCARMTTPMQASAPALNSLSKKGAAQTSRRVRQQHHGRAVRVGGVGSKLNTLVVLRQLCDLANGNSAAFIAQCKTAHSWEVAKRLNAHGLFCGDPAHTQCPRLDILDLHYKTITWRARSAT